MKNFINHLLNFFNLTSLKFTLRERELRLKEVIRLAYFWRWQVSRLPNSNSMDIAFCYLGRKSELAGAINFLGLNNSNKTAAMSNTRAIVSEFPIPGAICLPLSLSTVIPLKNRTVDDVLMGFEKRKRRLINSQVSNFKLEKVSTIEDIIRLDQEMLRPYSKARHGSSAYNFPIEQLTEMAFVRGQFNLLLHNNREVGCIIGHFSERNKNNYWQSDRMGFPAFIFNDMQLYRETNVMITYLQIQWAITNGFEYYDMGHNPAFTETGVVHHKRTFGGHLSTMSNHNYLYLKLPQANIAKFYWGNPLFAIERKAVVLHLGLPNGINDLELFDRYKQLNFGGLAKVYLHYETQCSESSIEVIRNIFSHLKSPPLIVSSNSCRPRFFEFSKQLMRLLYPNLILNLNAYAPEITDLVTLI